MNKYDIQEDLLFPTPIYKIKIDQNTNQIIRTCVEKENLKLDLSEKILQTNTHLHKMEEFSSVVNFLDDVMDLIARKWQINIESLYCSEMWGISSNPYHWHARHHHPNSWMSGIIFVSLPEGGEKTKFHDPRLVNEIIRFDGTPNRINSPTFEANVETGDILIFPSWLQHSVHPSIYNQDQRIVVAFNYNVHAKITHETIEWEI